MAPLLTVHLGFQGGFEWDHKASGWPRSLGLGRTQELALSPHKCGDISATSFSKVLGWASSKPQNAVGHFHSPSRVLSLEQHALW